MRYLTFVLVACIAGLGSATLIKEVSFEEMVASSNRIVAGHVTKSWTSWGSQHKFIWTRYEIAVDEALLGPKTATVVVSEPGGILDGKAMSVESAVRYTIGEHVTLFLQRFPAGEMRTVGWSQGKFTIDEANRVHSLAGSFDGSAEGSAASAVNGITYDELRQHVEGLLSAKTRGLLK